MRRSAKYLTPLLAMLTLALGASPAQAQRGTVQIISPPKDQLLGISDLALNQGSGTLYALDSVNGDVKLFDSSGAFLSKFGSNGSKANQLNDPTGLDVNQSTGDVYVADTRNHRVSEFDSSGSFIRMWGRDVVNHGGAENVPTNERQAISLSENVVGGTFELALQSSFTSPISFDAPATGSGSVQEALAATSVGTASDFSVSGPAGGPWTVEFVGSLGDADFEPMNYLSSRSNLKVSSGSPKVTITTSADGANSAEICTIEADCKSGVGSFGSAAPENPASTAGGGTGNGQFDRPADVAIDQSSGDVYVLDAGNNRVQVFDSSGNYLSKFGSAGSEDGQFKNASSIAVDPASGDLYVIDSGNDRVQVFDPAGKYLSQFGEDGGEAGQLRSPSGAVFSEASGDLYVGDTSNFRIQELDPSGAFVSAVGVGVDRTTHGDVCSSSSGDTCQAGLGDFTYTDPNGPQTVGRQLAVDPATGWLYVMAPDRVYVFDSTGTYLFQFGDPGGSSTEAFRQADAIAVAPSTGEVYVLDGYNNRILKFDSTGHFLFSFGWNVNLSQAGSAPEICPRPGSPADICHAGVAGSELGMIGGGLPEMPGLPAEALAIGTDGSVYVGEPGMHSSGSRTPQVGNRRVQVFSSSGLPSSQFDIPHEPDGCELLNCADSREPSGLAVDSGFVYEGPVNPGRIRRFTHGGEPAGRFAESQIFDNLPQIAVDQKLDRIYAYQASNASGQQYEVAEYDSSGNLVEQIGLGLPRYVAGVTAITGLAVQPGTTRAYASVGSRIFVLDTITDLPTSTISAPTSITASGATFHGTASSHSETLGAGYHFEYKKPSETGWTPVSGEDVQIGSGSSPVAATQTASGLQPNTTYQVRLVVTRELGGGSASSQTTFTTAAEPPATSLVAPTRVTDTTAILQALIDPRNSATTYRFEYGTDTSYGQSAPVGGAGSVGSGFGKVSVFEHIHGLQPGTTYHFRLVAENAAGTAPLEDLVFKTRTPAEVDWPARGIELVNPPDKGNQDVEHGTAPGQTTISPDGNKVLWKTPAGGPGSTTGAFVLHLSHFTPEGWVSQTVVPPASEQIGGGDLYYQAQSVSRNLAHYVFIAETGFFDFNHPHFLVRGDEQAHLDLLADFGAISPGPTVITDNGEHVLAAAPLSGALTDYEMGSHTVIETPSCGYLPLPAPNEWYTQPDASRLFLESSGSENCALPKGIYMIDRSSEPPTTTLVSGAQTAPARFLRMNDAGTEVLYSKGGDLYRWTEADGDACLSCGSGHEITDGVVSPDLSHVYFCEPATTRPCDMYVWREGGVRFVARTSTFGSNSDFDTTVVSADGTQLAFLSGLPATTTADDTGGDGSAESSRTHEQVFHYDDNTGYTECVSCSGERRPPGGALTGGIFNAISISADGQTIAFMTSASVSPEDINKAPDIYEWHNGLVRLVTDGESPFSSTGLGTPPYPWGLSDDGKSLIFSAGGVHITGHEHDNYVNVYDARAGGSGFPVEAPPAHCSEDACQGPLVAPPTASQPGSSSLSGPGSAVSKKRHRHRTRHHAKHRRAQKRHAHKSKQHRNRGLGGEGR
ncbi:MAG TPA: 6-bladed beta-propeller [Gemmatimonadales bacterium]|nr:6-bladed beta-propeller [Gemmatimonadales bacterium]